MTLAELYLKACEFDETKDGLAIVQAAEKSKDEYFTPKTDWTYWGDAKECYEHGYYGGAKYEREKRRHIDQAVADLIQACVQVNPAVQEIIGFEPLEQALAALRKEVEGE